jgi:sulfite reductase (ferredoxin)
MSKDPAVKSSARLKADAHEESKAIVNPWTQLEEICDMARAGYDAFPPEVLNLRLRWWGVYPQGDGEGKAGGLVPYFMLRTRIAGGILKAAALRQMAFISERYARGTADITVRQNIQFHWITPSDLPEIFRLLGEVGIDSMGACGDVTRNISGCPVSDLSGDPLAERHRRLLEEANAALKGHPDFWNLPRKFKITIASCKSQCSLPEINDVGIVPVHHPVHGDGYALRVAGGLSTRPHFSIPLHFFFKYEEVVPVLRGIASLFRDRSELRENRDRARLKFLFLEHGWDRNRFEEVLLSYLSFSPVVWEPSGIEVEGFQSARDHIGVHQVPDGSGHCYIGLSINQGALSPAVMSGLADLSESWGNGEIRLTSMQNLILTGIAEKNLPLVLEKLFRLGLNPTDGSFLSRTVSCTGNVFCRLALVETKEFSRDLALTLHERFGEISDPLNLHVTACPNACGQQRISEIGLQGVSIKDESGAAIDGYELFLGGQTGSRKSFNQRTGVRLSGEQVAPVLTSIIGSYLSEKNPDQDFRDFIEIKGMDWVKGIAGVKRKKDPVKVGE